MKVWFIRAAIALTMAAQAATPALAQDKNAGALDSLRKTKDFAGCDLRAYDLGDEVILLLVSDKPRDEATVKVEARQVSQVYNDPKLKISIIFTNRSNDQVKRAVVMPRQSASDPEDIALSQGRQAALSGMVEAGAAATTSTAALVEQETSKINTNLAALKKQGVGVSVYTTELSGILERGKSGNTTAALAELLKLEGRLDEQKQALASRNAPPKPAAPVATAAVPTKKGPGLTQDSFDGILQQFGHQSGGLQGYEGIAQAIMDKELGDLAPKKGPFRMERFTVARKIKQLAEQGKDNTGLRAAYFRMEDKVTDIRQVSSVREDLLYLQNQLGIR